NDFPDLERAADNVSERRFPLSAEDLLRLCRRHGLEIRWFDRKPVLARDKDREVRSMVRSFFEAPRVVYANRALLADPARPKFELTPAVVMRRMTKVSPYPYWHFFDAYPPGYLRAVYRGNGIPLPWGNLAQVSDPCPNWAVFRMIDADHAACGSQISVLRDGERSLLYCCHSRRVH